MLAGEILAAAMVTPRETPHLLFQEVDEQTLHGDVKVQDPLSWRGSPPSTATLPTPPLSAVLRPPYPMALAAPWLPPPPHLGVPTAGSHAGTSRPLPASRASRKPLRTPGTSPPGGKCRGPCLVARLPGAASTRHVTPCLVSARLPASMGPLGGMVGSESWPHPLIGHRAEPQWGPGGTCWMNERANK